MKPTHHALISGGLAAALIAYSKSWGAGLACFLSGVFIDLDHVPEFMFFRRKIFFSFEELWNYWGIRDRGQAFLPLHAWEWLMILWYFIFTMKLNMVWVGLGVGITVHLICDQIFNPLVPGFYFLWFRMKHNFERKRLYIQT